MTTVTDIVAFAVSSSTSFPAIRYFCIYAAVSLLLSYLLIMTVFVAFLSYDIKRIESGRLDALPCIVKPNYEPWRTNQSTATSKVRPDELNKPRSQLTSYIFLKSTFYFKYDNLNIILPSRVKFKRKDKMCIIMISTQMML